MIGRDRGWGSQSGIREQRWFAITCKCLPPSRNRGHTSLESVSPYPRRAFSSCFHQSSKCMIFVGGIPHREVHRWSQHSAEGMTLV